MAFVTFFQPVIPVPPHFLHPFEMSAVRTRSDSVDGLFAPWLLKGSLVLKHFIFMFITVFTDDSNT